MVKVIRKTHNIIVEGSNVYKEIGVSVYNKKTYSMGECVRQASNEQRPNALNRQRKPHKYCLEGFSIETLADSYS